ncbi:LapA family protein [Leptolyngbya sp. CCY15150]|uniref:LapA family protein n=1 Tax=Leptolyngbya sp. CCY15150 TaxID=2767772 RepID=UPI00195075B9|nr:LapA family protein [Leptolyngbya sp. CCY15150]
MRQINSVLIFVLGLGLMLFSIQNTDIVAIHVMQGIEFRAPLAIELLVAMGAGAMMAWVFSVWSRLQSLVANRQTIKQRDTQIKQLEKDLEQYKLQLENQPLQLPASPPSGDQEDDTTDPAAQSA